MKIVNKRGQPYSIEYFENYIKDKGELETLKNWLNQKDNLHLTMFEEPVENRFIIKIVLNSGLDNIRVIDLLDDTYVDLENGDSF